jgi:molecular chaperone IbpA
MRAFDPTPLCRSTVRFDRLFGLLDESPAVDWRDTYPPCDIERTNEDHCLIALAPEEVTITAEQNVLTAAKRLVELAGPAK